MRCVIIVYYVHWKISGYTRERLSKSIGGRKKTRGFFQDQRGPAKKKTWQLIGTDTLALKSDILPSGPPFSRIPKSVQNWWGFFVCICTLANPCSLHFPALNASFKKSFFHTHLPLPFSAFVAKTGTFFPLFKIVAIVQKHPAKLVDVMLTNDCPYF